MSSFAPGTPKSVMDEFNKKFYGSKQSQVDESPPQAEPAKGGKPVSKPLPKPPVKPQPPKPVAPPVKPQPPKPVAPPVLNPRPPVQPPRPVAPPVIPKPQPKTIVDPVRPSPVTGVKPITGGMGQTPRMKAGGSVVSASKRGDGIAQRGKTKGRIL